ncbi:MAG: sialidase family protein, partial [Gaiellaceae bacterium]
MGRASLIALVLAVMLGPPAADAAVAPSQQISSDPFTNAGAQHATEVEPDTFSFGDTVVAAFQVGRFRDGGATTIGWATSTDGGSSWTSGFLPSLTVFSAPAGRFSRVSDPAVAYDRAHGVWLISVLGWRDTGGIAPVSSLVVSRSPDGLRWSAPVTTAPEVGSFAHDKNWVVCDSGAASRFGGRCYTTWTDVTSAGALAVSTSLDGGLTWGVPVVGRTGEITGSQPVVRPDGVLVIPYLNDGGVAAVRSTDGGVSLGTPVRVSRLAGSQPPGLRAPPLPSAEVDAGGRVYVAWPDCRFRPRCERPGRRPGNDMVLSSSADGRTWTEPAAVPIGGSDQLLPGLGVDPTTQGTSARLALAYYALTPAGCTAAACRLG